MKINKNYHIRHVVARKPKSGNTYVVGEFIDYMVRRGCFQNDTFKEGKVRELKHYMAELLERGYCITDDVVFLYKDGWTKTITITEVIEKVQ